MKKLLCLCFSLILAVSVCAPAFSESPGAEPEPVHAVEETEPVIIEEIDFPQDSPASVQDTKQDVPAEEEKEDSSEKPAATPNAEPEKLDPAVQKQEAAPAWQEEPSKDPAQPTVTEIVPVPEPESSTAASETEQSTLSEEAAPAEASEFNSENPAPPEETAPAVTPETEKAGSSDGVALGDIPEENESREPEPTVTKDTDISSAGEEPPVTEPETEPQQEPAPVSELSKAGNLKLTSSGLTSVTLTFEGDIAPTKYRVYRATEKKGKYAYLGEAWQPVENSGKYRYDDLTAKKGITYYYKVRGRISDSAGVRWGNYSAVISGTTKPASVGKITGKSTSATSVKIIWNTVSGATGYEIARSTKLDAGYKTLKTITSGTTVSFTDKTAKMGTQYYYRVRAYYTPSGGSGKTCGPYSYSSAILCEPAAPKSFKVSKNTDTTVTLSWTPATGVEYYHLKYSWIEDGVKQEKKIQFIPQDQKNLKINNLQAGQALTFQIWSIGVTAKGDEMRSGVAECTFTMPGAADSESSGSGTDGAKAGLAEENTGALESDAQTVAEEEPLLPEEDENPILEKASLETAPAITGFDVTSSGVQLIWNETPGAETYRVERSGKKASGYKTIAQEITDSEFLDTTAVNTSAYYYRIIALDGTGTELTSDPKGVFVSTPLTLTAKRGSDGYYTLTWDNRKNAEQYRIYRSVDDEKFQKVKTLDASSARSWTDSDVTAGKTYVYYVKAWKTLDGEKVSGAKGMEKSIYVGVKENPTIRVTQDASTITVSWEKVKNANGYVIYGAKEDEKLTELDRVSASVTSWSQTPPAASGYLKYYVRAYAVVGSKNKFAPASDPVVIRRLAPPQITVERGSEEDTLEVRWSAVSGAQGYRVYYRRNMDEAYQYVEATERFAVVPAQGGNTASVYVRAQCTEGENTFIGSRSTIKSLTPYWKFALLIGNSQYTSKSSLRRLAMCAADVTGVSVVLDRQNGWNVNTCANMTGSEILAAISRFFKKANENCTCLFYYTGHGNMGNSEATGSMYGVDGSFVTLAQLKAALNAVPGRTIVLMDSCGSGAAVENESGAETLDEDKYSVITASAAYENSYANIFHSYFSYYLSFGSGWDYDLKKVLSTQPADADKDGTITFQEMCDYISRYLTTSTLTMKLPEPGAPLY